MLTIWINGVYMSERGELIHTNNRSMHHTNETTSHPLWRRRLARAIACILENKDISERWGNEVGMTLLDWGVGYLQHDVETHQNLADEIICARIIHKTTLINLIIRQVHVILGEQHSAEPLCYQQLRFQFANFFKTLYALTHHRTNPLCVKRSIELCTLFYQLTSYQLFKELLWMIANRRERDSLPESLPFFTFRQNKENNYYA